MYTHYISAKNKHLNNKIEETNKAVIIEKEF